MQHAPGFLAVVDHAKSRIREISVGEVAALQARGEPFRFIDVREDSEWLKDRCAGAEHLGRGVLERDVEARIPRKEDPIILYCGGTLACRSPAADEPAEQAAGAMSRKTPVDEAPGFGGRPFAALAGLQVPPGVPAPTPGTTEAANSPGPIPWGKLVVRRERKGHGGKVATVVEGLPANDLERIASDLKRKLGTGARVEDGQILVQGDLVERVALWLESAGAKRVIRGN